MLDLILSISIVALLLVHLIGGRVADKRAKRVSAMAASNQK